jgi:hypothetical protein
VPDRSARSSAVDPLVIIQSGEVLPSPSPLTGSLLVIDEIAQVGVEQLSVALQLTVTGTIRWLGGQSTFGLTEIDEIDGGVTSGEHMDEPDTSNAA